MNGRSASRRGASITAFITAPVTTPMTAQPRGGDGSIGYSGPGQGGTKLVLVEEGSGGGGGERHLCVAGSENGLVFCLLQRLPPSECLLGTRPLVDPAVFICMTAPRKTREFRLPKNVPRSAAEHVSPTSFPACRVCPTRRVFKAGVRCGACVGRRGGRRGGRVSGAVSGECASAPSCTAERVRPA